MPRWVASSDASTSNGPCAGEARPELHAQFAVDERGALAGFVLGRLLEGEFGRTEPGLRLELIDVQPGSRGRGAGRALERALEEEARRRGVRELRTTALWTEHEMLRFLHADGWRGTIRCSLRLTGIGHLARGLRGLDGRQAVGDAVD
jgi:GNAT superfamily N-acetyltransferase